MPVLSRLVDRDDSLTRILQAGNNSTIIDLFKRTSVENGGPDMKGLKYVIAAVVVPFGLIILSVLICIIRARRKNKPPVVANDNKEQMTESKMEVTIDNRKNGGSNIEIKVIPQDSTIFSKRKNMILQDIEKNGNLAEELRNNNYFNNYIDLSKRQGFRVSQVAQINVVQPSNSMKKRQSQRLELIEDMEEIDLSDNAQMQVSTNKGSGFSGHGSSGQQSQERNVSGHRSFDSRISSAIDEEFHTAESSPMDSAQDDAGTDAAVNSGSNSNVEENDVINEIPRIKTLQTRRWFAEDTVSTVSGARNSVFSNEQSVTTKNTEEISNTTDSPKVTKFSERLMRERMKMAAPSRQMAEMTSSVRRSTKPRSNSMKKLQDELSSRGYTHEMAGNRDSFLDRSKYDSALYSSTGEEEYEDDNKHKEFVRVSINLESEAYSSSNESRAKQLGKLEEVEEPTTSAPRDAAHFSDNENANSDTTEGTIDTAARVKVLSAGEEPQPATKIPATFKNIASQTPEVSSNSGPAFDAQLTDTINDINRFLKDNGVFTSPVFIDTGNVVLGGLVINNISKESLGKSSNINVMMSPGAGNAASHVQSHSNSSASPIVYRASVSSPLSDTNAIVANQSASSSNYDLVRRSVQSSKISKMSPLFSNNASPRVNSPKSGLNKVLSPVQNIAQVLSSTQKSPLTEKSPQIPQRSSKRSQMNIGQYIAGLSGMNAPVVSNKDSVSSSSRGSRGSRGSKNSRASRQSSNMRSSKALGINLMPQMSLDEEARLTNKTPDQVIRDKFYDSEESTSHGYSEDDFVPVKSPYANPYANMV